MSIIILGKTGQLASAFQDLETTLNITYLDRNDVDFTKPMAEQLNKFTTPKILINTVAYTAVDMAETEPELANQVNNIAVGELTEWCKANDVILVHFSTDYVFNGDTVRPYKENRITHPINVYGKTKLEGERHVLGYEKGIVIRVSWLYSAHGKNFMKTIIRMIDEGKELRIIQDQFGTPTSAHALAEDVLHIIQNPIETFGLFHYTHDGICSWYDFAKHIHQLKSAEVQLKGIETKDYPTKAKRPFYSKMSATKIKSTFNLVDRLWTEEVEKVFSKICK